MAQSLTLEEKEEYWERRKANKRGVAKVSKPPVYSVVGVSQNRKTLRDKRWGGKNRLMTKKGYRKGDKIK